MPNEKTDSKGYSTLNADKERDMAAKGGPSTSLGNADDKHGISEPYNEDLQTQIAAKGNKKHKEDVQQKNGNEK